MRNLLGIIIIILSIVLGLYVGVWLLFIGGIVQIVEALKMDPVSGMGIAIGLLRFISSSFLGCMSWFIGTVIGLNLLKQNGENK